MTPAQKALLDLLAAHPKARLRLNASGAEIVGLDLTKAAVHALRKRGALLLFSEITTDEYVLGPRYDDRGN